MSGPAQQPASPETPTETPPPAQGATKWSRGKLAGIIGGSCCGLLLLGFIGMIILGLIVGPTDEPTPSAQPTTAEPTEEPTTDPAPTEESTTEAEATEEPTEEPTEETTEEPTEETTPEPTEEPVETEDPQAWAGAVEQTALMGSEDWQELCGGDYSLGICWITGVSADRIGTLNVTLQLNGSDPESETYAEGAANFIFAGAGTEHTDLEWVVVYDASGVVIDQKKRSDYPLLND